MATLAPGDSTTAQQGSALSAHQVSGEDGNSGIRPTSSDGERVATDRELDDILGGRGGDVHLADLNGTSPTEEVQTDLPDGRPRQSRRFSIRRSLSSYRFRRNSSESIYSFKKATETIASSTTIKAIVALVSFLALLFTFVGFYPAYGQYYYSKLTWDASAQSANQSAALQEFQLKTLFYNSCQMNKMINNTVDSPDCEEALKLPPPTPPFPYIASPMMNKIKRQILEAICECDCKREVPGSQFGSDEPTISVTVRPTDTGALDKILFVFILVTIVAVLILRKRLRIIRKWRDVFEQNVPKVSPWIFRTPRHVNATEKSTDAYAQSSGVGLSPNVARRRGIAPREQRRQTIWEAAASGNMNVVQSHLSGGLFTELDKVHPRYGTPLCAACEGGDSRIVTVLLIKGANVNVQGGRFFVPIQAAAYSGTTTIVQFLLAKGADVKVRGGWSGTALQAACERGDAEMVQSILDAGAPVNIGGGSLGFPLQAAASRGALDIASLLIAKGADANEEGGEYGCALNAAVACGALELIDLLLKHGARVDLPPGDYGNCVQIALRHGYPALARSFVEKGANGDVSDEQRRTPLIEATILGDELLVAKLLEGGVDIDAQDEDKWSALHYAALEGKENLVSLLLEKGANVMLRDKFGAPALHRAAGAKGNLNIVRMLLDNGSEVDAQDVLGATALHQSAGIHEHVLKLLLERGANPNLATGMGETPLHGAVNANNLQIVKILIGAGSNLTAQDNDQATALFRSVDKGFYGISMELINCGADLNVRSANALQEALSKGQMDLAKLMIEKGAIVNSQGSQYGSPIQAAACAVTNSFQLVTLLLDHKANVNLTGGEFGSALAAACNAGNLEVVELLLDKGANVSVRGGRYGSVLRAAQFGNAEAEVKDMIIKKLEQYGAKVLTGVQVHDDDVWRLTPGGWTWLPAENRKDKTSAFGSG